MDQALDFLADNFWLLIPMVLIPSYLYEKYRTERLRRVYEQLANRWRGSVEKGEGGRPVLSFEREGETFTLSTEFGAGETRGRSKRSTTLLETYNSESLRFYLKLSPETAESSVDKALGTQKELKIGDAQFDRSFLIQTNKPELIEKFLDEQTRARLLDRERLHSRVYLKVNEGAFTSRVHGYLTDFDKLEYFLEESFAHFERVRDIWNGEHS